MNFIETNSIAELAEPPASCKVPTPRDLASGLVRSLGDFPGARWLEPSHGDGVFIRALATIGVGKERITAVDLDPSPGRADNLALTLRPVDFLDWSSRTTKRFDRIIGNPPYIAINRLQGTLSRIAASTRDLENVPIGKGANLWYAFILASISVLAEGGSLGFVLPSAAEFADYSSNLRSSIRKSFRTLEVFRSSCSLFDGVQEGTVVAIARGFRQGPGTFSREEFDNRQTLTNRLNSGVPLRKVTCPKSMVRRKPEPVRFGSIATIRLGGVTGDARFFLMSDLRRAELGLPIQACVPVVSRANQIRAVPTMTKPHWDRLKEAGSRIWLFSPPPELSDHPSVKSYLSQQEESGGCNRSAYKVLRREPWYRTPLPERADGFLSGMSQFGPWLTINEMPELNATNTLYVITFKEQNPATWYKWALAMLTTKAQRQVRRVGRRYADGLIKYEPGALGQIELPQLRPNLDYRQLYIQAVALLPGKAANKFADSCRS